MSEPAPWEEAESAIEALVRSAGNYVQPSQDLRPRVLEAAKVEQAERRAIGHLWQGALAVSCLVAAFTWLSWQTEWPAAISPNHPRNAAFLRPQESNEQPPGNHPWETADSFRDLRLRQARLFKFPF